MSAVDYAIFRALRDGSLVRTRPRVLELGEAEWYGDLPVSKISEAIEAIEHDAERRENLHRQLVELLTANAPTLRWQLGKLVYAAFFDASRVVSIDLHGTEAAQRLDLNQPIDLGERFDLVLSSGTAEHVFNVYQFFKTVHDVTEPRGVMMHAVPFQGWLEHGFYSFNPGFFWDLAGANGYEIVLFAYAELNPTRVIELKAREQILHMQREGKLGANSLLYAVLRKPGQDAEFRVPMQAFYAGTVSDEMQEAWKTLR